MADKFVRRNPVNIKLFGDKDRAESFTGEGNRLLYQLHTRMNIWGSNQDSMYRILPDGTFVEVKSFGIQDIMIIKSPPIVPKPLVFPEVEHKYPLGEILKAISKIPPTPENPKITPTIPKYPKYEMPEEERKIEWEIRRSGLVLQFEYDINDGPDYPGIFAKLNNINIDKLKYISYPQNADYSGHPFNGAIVESEGRFGYGFAWYDAIFQIQLSKMEVVSQLELKTNSSTLIHQTFDENNKIFYITLARDGFGEGFYNSELFKVNTRDIQGNPLLQIDKHIITEEDEYLTHLLVDPKNNFLYAGISGKQEIKDTSPDGIKKIFTKTLYTPIKGKSVVIGLDELGGSCLLPYIVAIDDGSGNLIDALNWSDGMHISGGTVNYTTGVVTVEFIDAVPSGSTVYFWASPSKINIYDTSTLGKTGSFLLPANKYAIQGPTSIIDKDDNLIITVAPSPYMVVKYGASGSNLGQLILNLMYPLVLTYGGGKYIYLAGEWNYTDPNTILKINIETMSIEKSLSIPRSPGDSPHILTYNPDKNILYLVTQFKQKIYEIRCSDLSYKTMIETTWNTFGSQISQSNRAFYRKETEYYEQEVL